jgi:hypothetical protein
VDHVWHAWPEMRHRVLRVLIGHIHRSFRVNMFHASGSIKKITRLSCLLVCVTMRWLCRYLVRQGATTWFVHYLINVKGVDTVAVAAAQVSGLEVGGFFGALSAGA